LFSGGKDSVVMLHLATKAFAPGPIPFPVVHIDTGQNFAEVLELRDRRVAELGVRLIVGSVQEAIDAGWVREERNGSRNRAQTPVLLKTAEDHGLSALMGAPAATRRRHARRSGCSRSATTSVNGTPRTNARNSGPCTTGG